jgi:hypothetical protein
MGDRDIREVLAQEFAATAAWRREVAEDHPEQRVHMASATALDQLTLYIRSLPPDDPRLTTIAELNRDPDFFLIGGDGIRELLDHYGTDPALASDPARAGDTFLDKLISAANADEDEDARRGSPPDAG